MTDERKINPDFANTLEEWESLQKRLEVLKQRIDNLVSLGIALGIFESGCEFDHLTKTNINNCQWVFENHKDKRGEPIEQLSRLNKILQGLEDYITLLEKRTDLAKKDFRRLDTEDSNIQRHMAELLTMSEKNE